MRDAYIKAAGEALTAKQAPHRPGIAPALGLRAGDTADSIPWQTHERTPIMWFPSLLSFRVATSRKDRRACRGRTSSQLAVEALEDRRVPALLAPLSIPGNDLRDLAAGDFNNDGIADLVAIESGDVSVRLGNGDGTFGSALDSPTDATGRRALVSGDFNADGNLDVVTLNFGSLSVLLGRGDGTFQSPSTFSLPRAGRGHALSTDVAATGDLNNDGQLDLVVGGFDYRATRGGGGVRYDYLYALLGDGAGGFLYASRWYTVAPLTDVVLADYTGDGNLDALTSLDDLQGNGDGTFQSGPNVPVAGGYLAAADLNGDGNLDVAAARRSSPEVEVALGRGDGTFEDAVRYQVGAEARAIATADFDGDGALDLATVNEGSDDVSVLLNRGDGTFEPARDFPVGDGPQGFAVSDFDGNGFADVATFNPQSIEVRLNDGVWNGPPPPPPPPLPSVTIDDVSRNEGRRGRRSFTFTVTLSAATDVPVTVSYATADGSATTGNSDYVARTGTLTFVPGETTKTITIAVKGDSKKEADEYFYLDLFGNSSNSLFTKKRGTGTILDDD
jgi:hypothetical protein